MTTCDLRTAPLFPVLRPDGQVDYLGLRELLLSAHQLADLAVSMPPAAAGMMRVLYAITARVTGLDKVTTVDAWRLRRLAVLRTGQLSQADIDTYLGRHDGRWDLFDTTWPWLQDPRLVEQAEAKSANVLDLRRPGDNSPIWWYHTHAANAPEIPVAEALQWLLTHHFYGSGGTGGARRINGTGDQYMSAGPLRSTMSFYPVGESLFETLVSGIPSPTHAVDLSREDLAPWEVDQLHDPLSLPPAATWPAGLLLGQSRHALLLVPNQGGTAVTGCYLTWGWKQRHRPLSDPYTIEERRNDGTWVPRLAAADRALWRDIDALLAEHPDHKRPAVLTSALSLPDSVQDRLRVRAVGFDQDRKATNEAWNTATTPPILRYMDEHDPVRAAGVQALSIAAADIAGVMNSALRNAYRSLGTGSAGKAHKDVPWIAPAEQHYWPHAERLFWQRLTDAEFTEPYRAYLWVALEAVNAATEPVAHQPAVARELRKVRDYLFNFAAKKNPRSRKEKPDGNGDR